MSSTTTPVMMYCCSSHIADANISNVQDSQVSQVTGRFHLRSAQSGISIHHV